MKTLVPVFLLLPFLMAGCGGGDDDGGGGFPEPDDVDDYWAEAVDGGKLQKSGDLWLEGGDPFTGWAKWVHSNGKREKLMHVEEGRAEGLFLTWHPNGKDWFKGQFDYGQEDGLWQEFDESGAKLLEFRYEDSVRTGVETKWHQNGKRRWSGQYTDGTQSGTWTYWDENGTEKSKQVFP